MKRSPYHGKISELKVEPYKLIVMRTSRQRYSLRVFQFSLLYEILRFGSRKAALSAMDNYRLLITQNWSRDYSV